MGYVAIKGGGRAIAGAEAAVEALRCAEGPAGTPLTLSAIEQPLAEAERRGFITRDLAHVRPTARGFDFLSDLQSLFLPDA